MGMILTPEELGMPPRFQTWRVGQDDAIDRITEAFNDYKHVVMCAPVGSGKTATYIAVALLNGWRVLVDTATKGLQDQLMRDFSCIGMADIRGRANYQCRMGPTITCEDGAHMKCPEMHGERCRYRRAYNTALAAQLVTTNYSYDILIHLYGDGLGPFDLVVLDEAHDCTDQITRLMGQTFTTKHCNWMLRTRWPGDGKPEAAGIEVWKQWARHHYSQAVSTLELITAEMKLMISVPDKVAAEAKAWGELVASLGIVMEAVGPWAVDRKDRHGNLSYRLEPLWPRQYASKVLYRDTPRVLHVSATVGHKTMDYMGLGPTEYDFQRYPYLFPIRRSPVYYLDSDDAPLMSYDKDLGGVPDDEVDRLIQLIDAFQGDRMDRNGIIHSVSYHLCRTIMDRGAFNFTYITHEQDSESTRKAIREFKRMAEFPPHNLVSPSIATGHDFLFREAEYQILPKVPFIVKFGSNIMAARCHKKKGGDPEYGDYITAQTIAQAIGRPMRDPKDRCETIILDFNFVRVLKKLRAHFPHWVGPLLQRVRTLPRPAPTLLAEHGESLLKVVDVEAEEIEADVEA